MTAIDLARRVVEAKAKGERLPLAAQLRTVWSDSCPGHLYRSDVESLVAQLCEVIVAMAPVVEAAERLAPHMTANVDGPGLRGAWFKGDVRHEVLVRGLQDALVRLRGGKP